MDIFERASRLSLRFRSDVGLLSSEDLWHLPLTSKGNALDLDTIARAVNKELKEIAEGSFVKRDPDPRQDRLELQLEILKHIIQEKLHAQAEAEKAVETAQRKRKLLGALAAKEEAELVGMTKEQIEAEIAKL